MNLETLANILADYKEMDASLITAETTFEELELDSLDTVELLMKIEDETGLTLDVSEDLRSVGDLLKALEAQGNA
ncbi:MAG TPA: acyl carrier protein [Clostridiales bacterium]|jgi:acyl carrier protein|nr:acyl carrier protein [Clostridiales bacterium]